MSTDGLAESDHPMKTVYCAATLEEADIIVAWLDEQGIAALVKDRTTAGTLAIPVLYTPRGIEVCVPDDRQAARAASLLQDHHQKQVDSGSSVATIEATCEECGEISSYSIAQRELVQSCPHCGAYLDVPGEPDEGDCAPNGPSRS